MSSALEDFTRDEFGRRLCRCGCGMPTAKPQYPYVQGHNRLSPEARRQQAEAWQAKLAAVITSGCTRCGWRSDRPLPLREARRLFARHACGAAEAESGPGSPSPASW